MSNEELNLSLSAFVDAVSKDQLIKCYFSHDGRGLCFTYVFKMRVLPDEFTYNLGIDSKRSLIEHLIETNESKALEAVFNCLSIPEGLSNVKDKIAYLDLMGEQVGIEP